MTVDTYNLIETLPSVVCEACDAPMVPSWRDGGRTAWVSTPPGEHQKNMACRTRYDIRGRGTAHGPDVAPRPWARLPPALAAPSVVPAPMLWRRGSSLGHAVHMYSIQGHTSVKGRQAKPVRPPLGSTAPDDAGAAPGAGVAWTAGALARVRGRHGASRETVPARATYGLGPLC
jgi:hypothetical protein